MKTLSREPWRGGQICGYQIAYGLPWSIFCGEFKKLGSPACEKHDKELREDNYGLLPKFAPGNALGVEVRSCSMTWVARSADGEVLGAEGTRLALRERFGFTLSWEAEDPDAPIPATAEEIAAWEAS